MHDKSTAYDRIIAITNEGNLSRDDCYCLVGKFSAMAEKLSHCQVNYKPSHTTICTPNITMIKCNSK